MTRNHLTVTLVAIAASVTSALPTVAAEPVIEVVDRGDDVVIRPGEVADTLGLAATDPLDLLVGVDAVRDHSLGVDVLEVWMCGASGSLDTFITQLESDVGGWFAYHSRGRYRPSFVRRGTAGSDQASCVDNSTANAGSRAEGAIMLAPGEGGFAYPGFNCGFSPCPGSHSYREGNGRYAFVGTSAGFLTTAAHEIGHMVSWPHSYTGVGSDQYDNALDLMSGNYGRSGNRYGSYDEPYGTAAINYYAAGWIDPSEVLVQAAGRDVTIDLATPGGEGLRMAVIRVSEHRYYTLAARIPSRYDPIPDHWAGVEVYEVVTCSGSELECALDQTVLPGFRRVKPHPAVPFRYREVDSYEAPLPHVISPGSSRTIAGVRVSAGAIDGQSISVTIDSPRFSDTWSHVFADDIEWLADSGITRGCNPPANTAFCPDQAVTRGEMAAFLHRALPSLPASGSAGFSDDDGSVFEADIEWLAATGVTRGCNPPANTAFCPDQAVTRGEMAAFLHRALPSLPASGSAGFSDDDGSVFEADIEWLAATGVTRGCNPPGNDRFCPNDPVTRGAMAAFLHRALGG